jgi:hypothetical protein
LTTKSCCEPGTIPGSGAWATGACGSGAGGASTGGGAGVGSTVGFGLLVQAAIDAITRAITANFATDLVDTMILNPLISIERAEHISVL